MKKIFVILFLIFLSGFIYLQISAAQTVGLNFSEAVIAKNTDFSLTVSISNVANLFGMAFDLDFDPVLVSFVGASEGDFLNSGCQTSLMTAENPAGKLIVGYTRLGSSCGGVSGSGVLMTLNFKAKDRTGINNFSFSNNLLCLLSGQECNYVIGSWSSANIEIIDPLLFLLVDLNYDYQVNADDSDLFKAVWGSTSTQADFNHYSIVNTKDFGIMMSKWGNY